MARTTVRRTEPPPPGAIARARVTPDMHDDLTILMRNGASVTDIIRAAVRDRADAYRRAWDYADTPHDQAPVITGCTYDGDTRPGQHPMGG